MNQDDDFEQFGAFLGIANSIFAVLILSGLLYAAYKLIRWFFT